MVTVHDVPANRLIDEISEKIKEMDQIEMPDWAFFSKTGVHKEKAPVQSDWWFKRASAVLRSVYLNGPIGVSSLQGKYGGKINRGSKPSRARKGSGSIIRKLLQQLEEQGLVKKAENGTGRIITPEGRSLLDNTAHKIMKEMAKDNPELNKYL